MKWLQEFWRWFSPAQEETPSESQITERLSQAETVSRSTDRARERGKASDSLPIGLRVRRDKIHIQVGVDFGTSTTKIAYQQIGGTTRRVNPLVFKHKLPHYPDFCIPSVAAFNSKGEFLLGYNAAEFLSDKPSTEGLRFLKLVLAGRHDKSFSDPYVENLFLANLHRWCSELTAIGIEHVVVAFLASTLHEARSILRSKYSGHELELAFNVCAPIDHIQNNPLKATFERVLLAAELTEAKMTDATRLNDLLEWSKVAYESAGSGPPSSDRRVFLVPESVGAIASYLASLQVRNGIHTVYDFGAGTTDVSIFELSNVGKGTPFTYWRSARNLPRGAQRIERLVADFLKAENPTARLSDLDLCKAVLGISNLPISLREHVSNELRALWEESHVSWREAYGLLRKQSEWEKEKVQVFVCGGAASLPFIKDIFAQSWMKGWGPYPIRDLPGPDLYDSINAKVPFGRLCVAYGLTTPQPELGEYVLPKDCPDHTPRKEIKIESSVYGTDAPDT